MKTERIVFKAVGIFIAAWFLHSFVFDRYQFAVSVQNTLVSVRFNKITGGMKYCVAGDCVDVVNE